MVLIFSASEDASTSVVLDWIHYLGGQFIRINDTHLEELRFSLELNAQDDSLRLVYENESVNIEAITSIWYRRHTGYEPQINIPSEIKSKQGLGSYCNKEHIAFRNALYRALYRENKKWLNYPAFIYVDKIHVLNVAKRQGLNVPPSLLTNIKEEVIQFCERHGSVIIKPASEVYSFFYKDAFYAMYTSKFCIDDFIKHTPDNFFPVYLQENISKFVEIRTFYLETQCFSMAIFSQKQPETETDFRAGFFRGTARATPFALPVEMEQKITCLMEALNLNSGSIDMILTPEGDYYFLEVNPVGQFGMVSYPCNYFLEKRIAEFLMN